MRVVFKLRDKFHLMYKIVELDNYEIEMYNIDAKMYYRLRNYAKIDPSVKSAK